MSKERETRAKCRAEVVATQRTTLGAVEIDGLLFEAAIPLDENNRRATRWEQQYCVGQTGRKKQTGDRAPTQPHASHTCDQKTGDTPFNAPGFNPGALG